MILYDWKYRWFGFWKEFGPTYALCPSIKDFIFPEIAAGYDKVRLRHYLTNAKLIASTSRRSFPCPMTGQRLSGSISTRTDGLWYWIDDLPDYIEKYGVCLPAAWLNEIENNGFIPPAVPDDVIPNLDKPPISPREANPPG